ncbi:MAG: hypothetical protein AAF431_13190 [Pseudomonadota bacterium]
MSQLQPALAGGRRVMALIAGDDPRTAHLRTALFLAVLLHLVLAAVLPDLPELKLQYFNRGSAINIFLKQQEKKKEFQQTLNQQVPNPEVLQPLVEPTLGSASPTQGDDSLVAEDSLQKNSPRFDTVVTDTSGSKNSNNLQPTIKIDRATIKLFAQQEAIREVEQNPEKVARFKRSFNSRRSFQRRSRADSYKNRYGDYYVRNSSSAGDICFVQKPEPVQDDYALNTVYFFRCDSEPQGLDLSPDS